MSMALIWLGEPRILCRSGKRKNDRAVFDQGAALNDPDNFELLRFNLDRIANFFLSTSAAV